MRQLASGAGWMDRTTHGYQVARRFFRGALVRQIFLTVYDQATRRSAPGWLYLCEGNVLLFANELGGVAGVVLEIEPADPVVAQPIDNQMLAVMLGAQTGVIQSLSVNTTHPVAVVNLAQRLLLLPDIQPKGTYGQAEWSAKTTYLTSQDSIARVQHLVQVIQQVQRGLRPQPTGLLPGLSPGVARANIMAVRVGFVFLLVFFAWVLMRSC